MGKLKDFIISSARPLPVILLADVSGSMSTNGKIDTLNHAVQKMIEAFSDEDNSRAEIHVVVITFGKGGARVHQPLQPASKIKWEAMAAEGSTPMGKAFDLTRQILEDRNHIPSRAYRPTIILVSDGRPTDKWREQLDALLGSERGSKAMRFAMAIGEDADIGTLSAFLANPEGHVFEAHEAHQIKQFFRWVTMSVTSRSRTINPNDAVMVQPTDLDDFDF